MSKDFEIILDECIDRILIKGATVEDCLASYPEKASELGPHLHLVTRANSSLSFTPSTAAKDRARQRLQTVKRELEQKERITRSSVPIRKRFAFSFRPVAVLAVFLIIATIMASSIGTVAASGSSLPGELLYPVKRATEQARLALELSQAGKAELHLSYAERRSEEISELVERGNTQKLEIALESLNESIEEASRSASAVQDSTALENLKSQLENSATRTIANLQTVATKVPEAKRSQTDAKVQTVSAAYGKAVEKVASRTKDPHTVAAPGIIQFWATNPPSGVERVKIEVGRIEAHLVAGPESQWVTVVSEPQIFDLVRLAETQKFLGEQKAKPGTYTRIKFEIIRATVVSGGKEIAVKLPSNSITLVRPFTIEEGRTTRVFLDFDGEKSLLATGQAEFILSPNVHALVNRPAQDGLRPEKESPAKKPAETREALRPPVKVDMEGTIEEVASASFTVKGKSIIINSSTKMNRPLEKGEKARVEALLQSDNTIVAIKVETENKLREKPTPTPATESKRGQPEAKSPQEQARKPTTEHWKGNIESMSPPKWTVKGREILLSKDTKIEGTPAVGFRAEVEGILQPGNKILATNIKITGSRPQPTPKLQDKPAGQQSTGQKKEAERRTPSASKAGEQGTRPSPSPSLSASPKPTPKPSPRPRDD